MKTNKLCGVEFGAPITLDEVPKTSDGKGDYKPYFTIRLNPSDGWTVEEFNDNNRVMTRRHVGYGMCHWTRLGALQQIEAMKALVEHLAKHAA